MIKLAHQCLTAPGYTTRHVRGCDHN